ncbi:MAG: hypothetical protein JXO44_10630, partial [Clostridia bacterium]|nr:hypothetical protein [Clostridia bacterium]
MNHIEGKMTADMLGDLFGDMTHWTTDSNLYPRIADPSDLNFDMDTTDVAYVSTAPIDLDPNEWIAKVTKNFTVCTDHGVSWTSEDSDLISITGSNATVLKGDFFTYPDGITLTASLNEAFKNVYYVNPISADTDITSILSQSITAGSEEGTSTDPLTASISVANSVSSVAEADIVVGLPYDTRVDFYGTDSTFTTTEEGSAGLTEGDTTTVYIKVTAQDGVTVAYYAVAITRATGVSYSNFLITKSSPDDSSSATSYYYVYAGNSSESLSSFAGSSAHAVSNTAYSTVDLALTDIIDSASNATVLYFADTGNTFENASGTLDIGNKWIRLISGTYTIKGAVKTTGSLSGNGLFSLDGASLIIDGAMIESADHGISNTGDGSVTVNSGTINASSSAICFTAESSGNLTVHDGTIFGTSFAIYATGSGHIIVNSGTITSENDTIYLEAGSSGNLTINGGEVLSSGTSDAKAICVDGSGDLTITGGKIYSPCDLAVDYHGSGSLVISGDLWNDTDQTGTLLSTDGSEDYGLIIGSDVKNAEIKGGTLLSKSIAVYTSGNISISGGLINTTGSMPALCVDEGKATITGGTIMNSNVNTNLDISNVEALKFPGTILLVSMEGETTELYISGGTITNTAETGYAIANCCVIPGNDSYVYLSGTPSITGNTATVYSYNNIYANDGNDTDYTGSPVSLFYSDDIVASTTVAVSGVNPDTNASRFSLKNEGYSLQLSGTDLIINEGSSLSSDSSLTTVLGKAISTEGVGGTVAFPITTSISVANSVSSVSATDIVGADDATVEFYGIDSTFTTTTGAAVSVALPASSTTSVYIKVTAQDGDTTGYYAVEITRAAAVSSDSSLTTVLGKAISTEGVGGTVAFPITTSISVENSVSSVSATDIVGADDATVEFYGTDSTFTTTTGAAVSVTLPASSITTVYIKVTAQDGDTTGYYAVGITRAAASSSSGSSRKKSSDESSNDDKIVSTQSNQTTMAVIVNGEIQKAGREKTSIQDGKTTVTVEVDNKVIEAKIDEAIKNNTLGTGNVIQVPVSDTKSAVVKVELTGDIVKKLETNTFDVSVKRENIEYIIPAEEFTISTVAKNLGILEKDLGNIKVEVQITKLDQNVVDKYNEVAKANGAEFVFPPVAFDVVAKTTKADGTSSEVEISKFSNYVERVMEIPAGVDPSKITTGVVFNPDGTYSHVPTEVYQKDGKWYAKLNSLTNSNYSVVWNPVTVKSVENHWAEDAVNDMASRLVIFNPESFEPNKAIT